MPSYSHIAWLMTGILLLLVHTAEARQKVYGVPFIENYTTNDHGAERQIYKITQDDNGIMYFGNDAGVLTFDGQNWGLIPLGGSGQAWGLGKDSQGRIYVGGLNDLGYLATDSLGQNAMVSLLGLLPAEDQSFGELRHVIPTETGVFFSSRTHVFLYREGRLEVVWRGEAAQFHLAWQVAGQFYIRDVERGLMRYTQGQLIPVPGANRYASEVVRGLLPYADGGLMLVMPDRGVALLAADGAILPKPAEIQRLEKEVLAIYPDALLPIGRGQYALRTPNAGCIILDREFRKLYTLNRSNGLVSNLARSSFVDQAGNLWFGSERGISHVLLNHPFTRADIQLGVEQTVLSAAFYEDKLYLGTNWGILTELPDGSFEKLAGTENQVWDLEVVGDRLYASFTDQFAEITPTGIRPVIKEFYGFRGLLALKSRPGHYVLHTSLGGLIHLQQQGGRLTLISKIEGFDRDPLVMLEDRQGSLWVCDAGGYLQRLTFNETLDRVVDVVDFKDSGFWKEGSSLAAVAFPAEPALGVLVGSGEKYYHYNPATQQFAEYEPLNGLISGEKGQYPLVTTPDGDVYTLVGNKHMRYLAVGNGFRADTLSFPKIDDKSIHNLFAGPGGEVFYLMQDGLYQFHPQWQATAYTPFKTGLWQVYCGDKLLMGGAGLSEPFARLNQTLPYDNNVVGFRFGAAFFDEPERTSFSYKLEGFDESWSSWTTVNLKEYANLHEGRYTFRVRSRNLYGQPGKEASFSFAIAPPWYRSAVAFVGYGLLGLFFITLIVRGYTYRLVREKEKLELIVEERTREISTQNEKLVALGRFKENMTAMIVHDLKNPLSVIIRRGENKTASLARKMLYLVMNILDVQKFEETEIKLEAKLTATAALLNAALVEVRDTVFENDLTIRVLKASDVKIMVDPALMERVLVNLLTNAIKYAPTGSAIDLEMEVKDQQLYFSIQDQGPGIPAEKLTEIFDRYSQVDDGSSRHHSTGLGLTFCKQVIEAHGGTIAASSEPGEGARFWFVLPGIEGEAQPVQIAMEPKALSLSQADKQALKQVLSVLREMNVHESTTIEELLGELEVEEGSALHLYTQRIINASYNGDETSYRELLELV